MLLIIDNYDSFTFNLVQYFAELGAQVQVIANDTHNLAQIVALQPTQLVISPGPGKPADAGISLAAIRHFAGQIPVLGVCLGHQSIAQAFGGKIVSARQLMHGKTSQIYHTATGLFQHLPQPFIATRYHSLIVETTHLPACFEITAWTQRAEAPDEIMGIQHRQYPLYGVQFHPESILTEAGHQLLKNFLDSVQVL